MKCTKYDDDELGLIETGETERHLAECADCARQASLDSRLDREIEALRGPIDDLGLWDRIESRLLQAGAVDGPAAAVQTRGPGKTAPLREFFDRFLPLAGRRPAFKAAAAALTLLVIGLTAWTLFIRHPARAASGLMASTALARVETEEREYLAAIEELEAQAGPKLARMDFSLISLYRDRLETIDAQIERCRAAIEGNPWNAHIRKYMLAALRDKKDTLGRILAWE